MLLFAGAVLALLIFLACVRPGAHCPLLILFISGFIYASLVGSYYLSQRLPPELLGVEVQIVAKIVDLPFRDERRLRFLAELESIKTLDSTEAQNKSGLIRLSWYGNNIPELHAGSTVQLVVKLKAPSGFMNPGGFDIEKWFAQNGIVATGYVRNKSFDVSSSVVAEDRSGLSALRNALQRKLLNASASLESSGVILALAVGDRSGISAERWNSFISTGTNHLLAISGLHISLVAGFFAFLVRGLWSYTWLARHSTRSACAMVAGLIAAFGYAAMAGFSVPTVRALIMFSVLVFLLLLRRHQNRTHGLALALIVVCIASPLHVLSPGFWMSFAAVAVLYIVFSHSRNQSKAGLLLRVLRGHLLITIGLYPLTILFFGQASLVSPIANLIITPVIGMLVTPLVFIAALLTLINVSVASLVLSIADLLLRQSFSLLEILADLPFALIKISGYQGIALLMVVVASCMVLLPLSRSIRSIAFLLILPLLQPLNSSELQHGEYRVVFLDVGQGTSVVVKTARHVLVYDTGDQFSQTFNAADAVIIPYLRSVSVTHLHKLVVSHADRDHSGGADELLDALTVEELMLSSPLPQRPEHPYRQCVAGDSWNWDGVSFEVLHPSRNSTGSENNRSCVLLVSSADDTATLLPGDIESPAERQLLANQALRKVSILMSPHHGSASSSTNALLHVLKPDYVVHSAGYKNRFDFPRTEVVERYQVINAKQYTTASTGALEFTVTDAGVQISGYRNLARRWWHRQ